MKKNKGFTLMEMLIVVAIIAVLVAIAIPTFTASLEKSKEATDAANLRAAYASCTVYALDKGENCYAEVEMTQGTAGFAKMSDDTAIGSVNLKNLPGYAGSVDTLFVWVDPDGTMGIDAGTFAGGTSGATYVKVDVLSGNASSSSTTNKTGTTNVSR